VNETPEVQVGVLAHALMETAESGKNDPRNPWSQRPYNGKRSESRWSQSNESQGNDHHANGAPERSRKSRPIWKDAQPETTHSHWGNPQPRTTRPITHEEERQRSRPHWAGQPVESAPEDGVSDELHSIFHVRE
jgi:hypothetical protein